MNKALILSPLAALLLLGACETVPTGPSMMVLPGTGKNFDQFRFDDSACRQYAYDQVGGTTPGAASDNAGARSAAVGTVLGAAAGAAIGGSRGAGVGAGTGLLMGGAAGTGAASASARTSQQRYDIGYVQCMYAKGHRVPVSGQFTAEQGRTPAAPNYPPPNTPPPAAAPR